MATSRQYMPYGVQGGLGSVGMVDSMYISNGDIPLHAGTRDASKEPFTLQAIPSASGTYWTMPQQMIPLMSAPMQTPYMDVQTPGGYPQMQFQPVQSIGYGIQNMTLGGGHSVVMGGHVSTGNSSHTTPGEGKTSAATAGGDSVVMNDEQVANGRTSGSPTGSSTGAATVPERTPMRTPMDSHQHGLVQHHMIARGPHGPVAVPLMHPVTLLTSSVPQAYLQMQQMPQMPQVVGQMPRGVQMPRGGQGQGHPVIISASTYHNARQLVQMSSLDHRVKEKLNSEFFGRNGLGDEIITDAALKLLFEITPDEAMAAVEEFSQRYRVAGHKITTSVSGYFRGVCQKYWKDNRSRVKSHLVSDAKMYPNWRGAERGIMSPYVRQAIKCFFTPASRLNESLIDESLKKRLYVVAPDIAIEALYEFCAATMYRQDKVRNPSAYLMNILKRHVQKAEQSGMTATNGNIMRPVRNGHVHLPGFNPGEEKQSVHGHQDGSFGPVGVSPAGMMQGRVPAPSGSMGHHLPDGTYQQFSRGQPMQMSFPQSLVSNSVAPLTPSMFAQHGAPSGTGSTPDSTNHLPRPPVTPQPPRKSSSSHRREHEAILEKLSRPVLEMSRESKHADASLSRDHDSAHSVGKTASDHDENTEGNLMLVMARRSETVSERRSGPSGSSGGVRVAAHQVTYPDVNQSDGALMGVFETGQDELTILGDYYDSNEEESNKEMSPSPELGDVLSSSHASSCGDLLEHAQRTRPPLSAMRSLPECTKEEKNGMKLKFPISNANENTVVGQLTINSVPMYPY